MKIKDRKQHLPTTRFYSLDSRFSQKGFTLLEVLIAMALMSGIAFLITKLSGDLASYSLRFNRGLFYPAGDSADASGSFAGNPVGNSVQ